MARRGLKEMCLRQGKECVRRRGDYLAPGRRPSAACVGRVSGLVEPAPQPPRYFPTTQSSPGGLQGQVSFGKQDSLEKKGQWILMEEREEMARFRIRVYVVNVLSLL